MIDQIINAIVPIAITVIISVLTAVINAVGKAAIKYIEKKKEAVMQEMCTDKYNCQIEFARAAWGMVDEYFRISPSIEKTFEAKQSVFDKILSDKYPELKSPDIIQLRQTIAAEINKDKNSSEKKLSK